MYSITQGTIVSGIRSEKYPDTVCSGIVISARCDLANCKVHNVYYLIAIPVREWLLSDEGFHTALLGRINDLEGKLEPKIQSHQLDWDSMKRFTPDEFERVITEQCQDIRKKDRDDWVENFKTFTQYNTRGLPIETKRGILSQEQRHITNYLLGVANGQATHFAYIPEDAYHDNHCLDDGLIVDLQELDRVDAKTADVICAYEMDSQSHLLSEEEIVAYNRRFFLYDEPGYAVPDCDIKSPWIEYLMQRFSNSFIRIGVDGPQKTNIQSVLSSVFNGGKQ